MSKGRSLVRLIMSFGSQLVCNAKQTLHGIWNFFCLRMSPNGPKGYEMLQVV